MTQRDAYVDLTEVRLHYVEEGEGPAVVLLHGFPDFWYSWRHQLPVLSEAGFRVIAPDMRGYNLSDKPRGIRHYTLDRLATDVVELVSTLGEESVHLVGHDWGGVVAWAVAGWHPDVVERLAVLNAPHPDAYRAALARPKQFVKSWYTAFFQLPGAPAVLKARDFATLKKALSATATEHAFTDEDLLRYVDAWRQPRALESQLAYYRAGTRYTFGRNEGLPRVDVPVLVIWGERDPTLEPFFADIDPNLASNVVVERVPHATHWVHMDDPDVVNRVLLDFLNRS